MNVLRLNVQVGLLEVPCSIPVDNGLQVCFGFVFICEIIGSIELSHYSFAHARVKGYIHICKG